MDVSIDLKNIPSWSYKKIMANPQIFMSKAGLRKRLRLKGSSSASDRSRLMRRTMKELSLWVRNLQDLWALSGKSTRKIRVKIPMIPVIWKA